MAEKRKDNKGTNLRTGESQGKDGRYMYRWTVEGKEKTVYALSLEEFYFPAATGTIISFDAMSVDENGNLNTKLGNMADTESEDDKYKHFVSQVTYEYFKELMQEMESMIGENGSQYSPEIMVSYFGMSEMTYGEACEEYNQTIIHDKVTGGFARLFCDYMGLELGLYPIFLVVLMWMKDRMGNAAELI